MDKCGNLVISRYSNLLTKKKSSCFETSKYFTISGPYGNLWRGGRALNPFPFSQQANLPRPQSNQRPVQQFRAQPHPEAELRHQTKATQSEQVKVAQNNYFSRNQLHFTSKFELWFDV